jgi:hypothetical protein
MLVISIPLRRATIAWPSSWRMIEKKKRNAETTARVNALLSWPGPKVSL